MHHGELDDHGTGLTVVSMLRVSTHARTALDRIMAGNLESSMAPAWPVDRATRAERQIVRKADRLDEMKICFKKY
jgi:hypothetical protein